jgi:hypothetical protein
MRNRLIGRDGVRMLYFVDCCRASIRTIPRLQHDPLKGEDIDTQSVDHVADETRYACMARPWLKIPNLEEHINRPCRLTTCRSRSPSGRASGKNTGGPTYDR